MLRRLIRWAVTKSFIDNSGQFPVQQVQYLGKVGDSTALFPVGMFANFKDDLGIVFSVGGNPENRAHIPVTSKSRPELEENELAIFHPLLPDELFIKFQADGELLIQSGVKINIVAPETEFTGIVKANGKVIDDTHGHTQGNDSDGDTEAAISGVT